MKTKIFLLAFTAFINAANAQRVIGGASFVKLGYICAPGSGSTFTKIAPRGISGFTNNYASFGAEGFFRASNAIIGLEANMGVQGVYSSFNAYSEPFVGAAHVKFGWVITGDERYWVYPTVGAGASGMVLNSYNKVSEEESDYDLLILLSPSLDLGINADFVLNKVNKESNMFGGFIVGIRAGYRMSYKNSHWRNEHWEDVFNMPSYHNNAFYVTFAIGGGWFAKRGQTDNQ